MIERDERAIGMRERIERDKIENGEGRVREMWERMERDERESIWEKREKKKGAWSEEEDEVGVFNKL